MVVEKFLKKYPSVEQTKNAVRNSNTIQFFKEFSGMFR